MIIKVMASNKQRSNETGIFSYSPIHPLTQFTLSPHLTRSPHPQVSPSPYPSHHSSARYSDQA